MLTFIYAICALLLALYTLGHGVLLIQYLRHHRSPALPEVADSDLPTVTVQLPIYNEQHVAIRLLDAVCRLDYPSHLLRIQVLDDSTDATTAMIASFCARDHQVMIEHIRRPDRQGYKAGALAYGMARTDSAYITIFDADFVPPVDFLRQTVPYLVANDQLALVQTRWGHLNADHSGLTRAQALAIDNHFWIEQTGRTAGGWFVPFNGTGGVWRKTAIEQAGGWSDETLTEDLDLSFRVQLAGWKALYLPHVVVAGELPPQLAAYRQQQARWAQGTSQNLRKLFVPVWQSNTSLMTRLMATQHIAQYLPHLLMLIMILIAPILLRFGVLRSVPLAPLGIIGLIPPLMLVITQMNLGGRWWERLLAFPILLVVGTGLVWNNAISVLIGLGGKRGVFHRTPKFANHWQHSRYVLKGSIHYAEACLTVYLLWGVWMAIKQEPPLVPYLSVYAISFALMSVWTTVEQWWLSRQGTIRSFVHESGSD